MFDFASYGLSSYQWLGLGLAFAWTGFVRTGLGFGGAALGLPFMLLLLPDPQFFLPVIGLHLLFFSSLTLFKRIQNVDWRVVRNVMLILLVPKLLGVVGLLSLPSTWLTLFVFLITAVYGVLWLLQIEVRSQNRWIDALLLILGGYVSGTSLIGAPLIVAVVVRYVERERLRETLFILWLILVVLKLTAFSVAGVPLHVDLALLLLPLAAIGHIIGLKVHDHLLKTGEQHFRRVIGLGLLLVSLLGIVQLLF